MYLQLTFVSMSGCYLQHLLMEVVDMKSNETKRETLEALNVMIRNVDQGVSGFWVEDYKGCGNPRIFPEFEEGLASGRLVQKKHYLCMWNTAVLYGNGHGNINTGCYYSCSITKAQFLSEEMIRNLLIRFKKRLLNGDYDCKDNILPLLTTDEINCIETKSNKAEKAEKRKCARDCKMGLKKADSLIKKYPKEKKLFETYYGKNVMVTTYDGVIDFNRAGFKDIVGAEKFTYDDYLDVQIKSFHKTRGWFANCYYNIALSFKGRIEKKIKEYICFERIMVEGMYSDGSCFDGKEEHVWMNIVGFENYKIGACVSFYAEVYRYVKKSNGKQIDFALRNPEQIQEIESYELPSDNDLREQEISSIFCESCYLRECCSKVFCLLSKGAKNE